MAMQLSPGGLWTPPLPAVIIPPSLIAPPREKPRPQRASLRATQLVGFGAGGSPALGPPAGGGDPEWANVVLLASWDGLNGATAFTDESPAGHALTFVSAAALSNASAALGYTTSLAVLTDQDQVTAADSDDWCPAASPYCIETVVNFSAFAAGGSDDNTILSQWGVAGKRSWLLRYYNTGGTLDFLYSTTGSNAISVGGAWSPSTATDYHVAVDIDGAGNIRVYAGAVGGGGSLIAGPTARSASIANVNQILSIGGRNDTGLPNSFEANGYLNETRLTKASRYASAFTPASTPFPRGA